MKLKRFLEVCTEKFFAWWDEDDYHEYLYTQKALANICDQTPLAWNLHNYEIKRDSALKREYTSGMGTLAGRVDALRAPTTELLAKYPNGRLRVDMSNRPVDVSYEGEWRYGAGALDAYMKRILKKRGGVALHTGERCMTFHSKTNTRGGRDPKENVDYA